MFGKLSGSKLNSIGVNGWHSAFQRQKNVRLNCWGKRETEEKDLKHLNLNQMIKKRLGKKITLLKGSRSLKRNASLQRIDLERASLLTQERQKLKRQEENLPKLMKQMKQK